jgi:hypothetical protein
MNDDGSRSTVRSLRNEWALFWESITGVDNSEDAFQTGKLEILSPEQLHEIAKALSQDRKRLHQKLESLNKELELNTAKLESLRLIGNDEEDTLRRIGELNDLGQILSEQLNKLDEKIRWTRVKHEEIFANR